MTTSRLHHGWSTHEARSQQMWLGGLVNTRQEESSTHGLAIRPKRQTVPELETQPC